MCAFPYILAFTADSIEVRLVINGNLIQTMVMPRLSLITSKADVFFATTAPEFFTLRGIRSERPEHKDSSPPSSPHCNQFTNVPLIVHSLPNVRRSFGPQPRPTASRSACTESS